MRDWCDEVLAAQLEIFRRSLGGCFAKQYLQTCKQWVSWIVDLAPLETMYEKEVSNLTMDDAQLIKKLVNASFLAKAFWGRCTAPVCSRVRCKASTRS